MGFSFCPWYGKEGQNKGTVVNHLQTRHYHLGLICSHCTEYFTRSTNAMCWHSQLYKPALAGINNNDDWEEESDNYDNSWPENMMTNSYSMRINTALSTSCPPTLPHVPTRAGFPCWLVWHYNQSLHALCPNAVGHVTPKWPV